MKLEPIEGIIDNKLRVKVPAGNVKLLNSLIEACTYPNPAYVQAMRFSKWGKTNLPKYLYLCEQDGNWISVPRGMSAEKLAHKSARIDWRRIKWKDKRNSSKVSFPALKLVLNKEQRTLLDNFRNLLSREGRLCPFGNVVYVAPTSAGKTIVQATIAKETQQRTLVLCLTELIKKAWEEDLYKAFGFGTADIGLIQRQKWEIGEHVTLASVMTLIKRKHLWPELFKQIGCLIVDEAHTVTAPSIHEFIQQCPAKYIIGATATDARENSSNFYLGALFGKVRKRITAQQKDTASSLALKEVELVATDFEYETPPHKKLDWHDLASALTFDFNRNSLIAQRVYSDWKRGESVVVATKRIEHVEILVKELKDLGVDDVNELTGRTNSDKKYSANLVSAIFDKNVRCIVSTTQAIKLGANLNPLSVLHLAMPIANQKDVEQLAGRIRRRADKKKHCKVVYYLDSKVGYLNHLYKRVAIPVFRKLKVPGYRDLYVA